MTHWVLYLYQDTALALLTGCLHCFPGSSLPTTLTSDVSHTRYYCKLTTQKMRIIPG